MFWVFPRKRPFFFFFRCGGESIQWSVSFVVFLFQKCYSTCQAVEAFILFFILKELYIKSSYFVHLDAQKLSSIKVWKICGFMSNHCKIIVRSLIMHILFNGKSNQKLPFHYLGPHESKHGILTKLFCCVCGKWIKWENPPVFNPSRGRRPFCHFLLNWKWRHSDSGLRSRLITANLCSEFAHVTFASGSVIGLFDK